MATKEDKAILNCVLNPLLPFTDCNNDELIPEELKDEEEHTTAAKESKQIELEAIKASETGELSKAIQLFSEAIIKSPNRPAVYNNRAQAYRLKGDIDEALLDLDKTIEVSRGKGKSACLAYCQRGLIHRLQGREEAAKSDFQTAADMGSKFASLQLVQMNSYAALCNDMLNKVLDMYRKQLQLN